MASKLPYNSLPNLGDLQAGDIVPMLRPPFQEGSAFVSDVQKYVRPYDVYTALISQSGTDAPTAIVLENTIGELTWSYIGAGNYLVNSDSLFTSNKTVGFVTNNTNYSNTTLITVEVGNSALPDSLQVLTYDNGTNTNDILYFTPLEIRVYYSEPA